MCVFISDVCDSENVQNVHLKEEKCNPSLQLPVLEVMIDYMIVYYDYN